MRDENHVGRLELGGGSVRLWIGVEKRIDQDAVLRADDLEAEGPEEGDVRRHADRPVAPVQSTLVLAEVTL